MASSGRFIKHNKEKKGWSQTEFGALLKINAPLISRIENDKKPLAANKLKLLAEWTKVRKGTNWNTDCLYGTTQN